MDAISYREIPVLVRIKHILDALFKEIRHNLIFDMVYDQEMDIVSIYLKTSLSVNDLSFITRQFDNFDIQSEILVEKTKCTLFIKGAKLRVTPTKFKT